MAEPSRLLDDITNKIIPFCKEQHGIINFGSVGFCFGGFVTFLASQLPSFLCGVGVHASIKLFNFYGSTEINAVALLQCPQLLIQGHNDPPNTKPNGAVHMALLERSFGTQCNVVELSEVAHGWLPRGDLSDPVVVKNIQITMELMMHFLQVYL